jgi:D-amino peptidase
MRKLYLSVDMEGVACICDVAEIDKSKPSEYEPFREQMSAETAAACEGAFEAGIDSILVKDAHWTGRNIDPRRLRAPDGKDLRLIRAWSGHPFGMIQDIDASFEAAAFLGYHSAAGSGGNPLSHTMNGGSISRIELNGVRASEFLVYGMAAATLGIPVAFLSGDRDLCREASALIEGLTTVEVLSGAGASAISICPETSVRLIREGLCKAMASPLPAPMSLPDEFYCKVTFARPKDAYAKSFLPGAKLASDCEVVFESRTYMDVLTFLWFAAT